MVGAGRHKFWTAAVFAAVCAVPGWAERLTPDAAEFPVETEALVAATASLFETVESRASSGRFPSTPPATQATPVSISKDVETLDAFRTENGPVRHLTGYRITWYPVDRLIGAVDFMGTWDNARNLVCGYVTWDLSNPEKPIMQSLVTTYVDVSEIVDADRFSRETALLEANCAFGDIDMNYAALN